MAESKLIFFTEDVHTEEKAELFLIKDGNDFFLRSNNPVLIRKAVAEDAWHNPDEKIRKQAFKVAQLIARLEFI